MILTYLLFSSSLFVSESSSFFNSLNFSSRSSRLTWSSSSSSVLQGLDILREGIWKWFKSYKSWMYNILIILPCTSGQSSTKYPIMIQLHLHHFPTHIHLKSTWFQMEQSLVPFLYSFLSFCSLKKMVVFLLSGNLSFSFCFLAMSLANWRKKLPIGEGIDKNVDLKFFISVFQARVHFLQFSHHFIFRFKFILQFLVFLKQRIWNV